MTEIAGPLTPPDRRERHRGTAAGGHSPTLGGA
jgi:hypothetical protein